MRREGQGHAVDGRQRREESPWWPLPHGPWLVWAALQRWAVWMVRGKVWRASHAALGGESSRMQPSGA